MTDDSNIYNSDIESTTTSLDDLNLNNDNQEIMDNEDNNKKKSTSKPRKPKQSSKVNKAKTTVQNEAITVIPTTREEKKETVKRKVGRPKKNATVNQAKIYGIVQTPTIPDNIMEFVYFDPTVFKKFFSFLKAANVSEIPIRFEKDKIVIHTMDHKQTSNIYIEFKGEKAVLYYCKSPFTIYVKRESIDDVLKAVDKHYTQISLYSVVLDQKSKLYLQLVNSDVGNIENYGLQLINDKPKTPPSMPIITNKNYPIRFKLTSKNFRKIITDYGAATQKFSIEKMGKDLPLQLTYMSNGIHLSSDYKDEAKIELFNNLGDDDMFSVTLRIDYVKPITRALVSKSIEIYVDTQEPARFKISTDDGVCNLYVYTNLYIPTSQ